MLTKHWFEEKSIHSCTIRKICLLHGVSVLDCSYKCELAATKLSLTPCAVDGRAKLLQGNSLKRTDDPYKRIWTNDVMHLAYGERIRTIMRKKLK